MEEKTSKSFVYILSNDRGNVVYVGCTEDLKKRIYLHKKRLIAGFTKKYRIRFSILWVKRFLLRQTVQS